MSTIKSSAENLTLNADGANNDVIIQSNGSTKVTVDGQNSRVGIGETSPDTLLHLTSNASSSQGIKIENTSGSTNGDAILQFTTPSISTTLGIDGTGTDVFKISNGTALGTNDVLTINSSNNVGIGTVTPARKLHVNSSDANVASFEGHQGEGLVISSGTNGQIDIIGYDDGASAYNPIAIRSASAGGIFLDTTGAVTMPAQPAFSATKSGAQNDIAVGQIVTVTFDGERFDQNSDFDLANNRFTAPVTGKYQINVVTTLAGVDQDSTYIELKLTTSNFTYTHPIVDPAGFDIDLPFFTISASMLVDMDVNDTVLLALYIPDGAAQTDVRAGQTHFSGYLVC